MALCCSCHLNIFYPQFPCNFCIWKILILYHKSTFIFFSLIISPFPCKYISVWYVRLLDFPFFLGISPLLNYSPKFLLEFHLKVQSICNCHVCCEIILFTHRGELVLLKVHLITIFLNGIEMPLLPYIKFPYICGFISGLSIVLYGSLCS